VQQVHTAETSARETTGGATEAVGARDDRRRYGSCRRVRRPAALRKLSARETTGRATEAAGAGRARSARSETSGAGHRTSDISAGRARPARKRDQRGTSGDRPAGGDQWRKLPDEPGASGSARRVRAEANQSSGEAPEGQARAERAKLWVAPGTSGAKEFEDGRKRQAALRRSRPLRR